jgi:hypothetical protein
VVSGQVWVTCQCRWYCRSKGEPEIWIAFLPTCFDNNDLTVSMKIFGVSGLPLLKEKTGKLYAMFSTLESLNFVNAEKGQQLLFFIWNMSMKSP